MFCECKMMNTTLRAFVEQLRKQIDSEVGALRGAPARKGCERRSASEGKTCPS